MTLAHARALITRRRIIEAEHQPERDHAALTKLANWAMRFTPLVAVDAPSGLVFDVTGCHMLYRDERRMLNAIGNSLERLGLPNRLCCAGTIGSAWAASRFGKEHRSIIQPGGERAALEALPIEALRLDPATAESLHEVNVDRIGHVLALPRLELAARFDATLLQRLDQALGDSAEVMRTECAHEPIVTERVFSGATTNLEALFIVTHELLEAAAAQLAQLESGAVRIDLTLTRLDADPLRITCRLSRPSRDAKHLFTLIRPKVESANMGFGVERMTLVVTKSQRVSHRQHAEFDQKEDDTPGDRATGELIDTLSHRLGVDRAVRVEVQASHLPERTTKLTPALTLGMSNSRVVVMVDADRPSLLLTRPELIEVLAVTPDGPPMWLRWRGVEHRIASAAGPERINCEWWSVGKDESVDRWRDYFKVQDERGRWLWVFRAQHTRRWFAHGEWA